MVLALVRECVVVGVVSRHQIMASRALSQHECRAHVCELQQAGSRCFAKGACKLINVGFARMLLQHGGPREIIVAPE